MAKNPAILFYTSDFLTGTILMTDEQVGKYIRLLCLQHQKGRLRKKDMLNICGTYDEEVFNKFIVDEDGLYYNKRMEDEAIKRDRFCDTRRENRLNKDKKQSKTIKEKEEDMINTSETYVAHMENENENRNMNIENVKEVSLKKEVFVKPTIQEIEEYANEKEYEIDAEHFFAFYESNGWRVGKNPMKSWKASVTNWVKQQKTYSKGYQTRDEKIKEEAKKIPFVGRGLEI